MRDYNEVFGYEAFGGFMTAAQLKRRTECIREYKGYSIAFGKYQRDAEGKAWWSVRVWKNDGKDRLGFFTMEGLSSEYAYPIKVETINYWKQKKDVTFLFLVDAVENKAYWVDALEYLKGEDISNQNSVTIRIPQNQVISFDSKELPSEFVFAIIKYYCNFAPYVNEQLKSIQNAINNFPVGKEAIEIFNILQKNIMEVNNQYKETIIEVLNKIQYDFGKTLIYATKLDQMDDIVRVYCVNGVFNDSSLGYDGKSLRVILQEVNDLKNKEIDTVDDLEKLLLFSEKIEEVEGNVMGFYREMAYEDCPMGDHSDIENDFEMYLANRRKV